MSDRDGKPDDRPAGQSADERALSQRMRDLERRLDASQAAREANARSPLETPPRTGYGLAMRLGADFVAGVLVGAAIGWGIDRFFGTSPWGLIVFLLLGFAAGILSVMRTAGLVTPGPSGPDQPRGKKG
jgi:ATP synthase protein I